MTAWIAHPAEPREGRWHVTNGATTHDGAHVVVCGREPVPLHRGLERLNDPRWIPHQERCAACHDAWIDLQRSLADAIERSAFTNLVRNVGADEAVRRWEAALPDERAAWLADADQVSAAIDDASRALNVANEDDPA